MLADIKAELLAYIDVRIVEEILDHHNAMKTSFRIQDWEKCLLRGGKLGEALMKAIHFIRTGKAVQQIHVHTEINEVSRRSDLPESIRLLVPRAVMILYDHRSRRGGAHGSFEPNVMDCTLVVAIADWAVSELVRLYCTADPDRAMKFAAAVSSKSVPIVERVEGDYVVLQKGASARQEISLILYSRYPERTTVGQLKKWIPNHSAANISLSVANMRRAKLMHCNADGAVLTAAGIRAVEEEISQKQLMANFMS